MAIGSSSVRSGLAFGELRGSSSPGAASGVTLKAREFTCDGETASKVDCDAAAKQGAKDYCSTYASALVKPGYSVFKWMKYLACRDYCLAAWADCLTVEEENADPPGGDEIVGGLG